MAITFWLPWISEAAEQSLSFARAAESMGYGGILVGDHIAVPEAYASVHPSGQRVFEADTPFLDPLCTVSAMAGATQTVEFATYVYVLPLREPLAVAKQVASTAILSEYRLSFGVGAGWLSEEFALMGIDTKTRGRRMDEMLDILQRFWQYGTADYRGEFFDIPRCGVYPKPAQSIPIWIGGKSRSALQRAARYQGWVGMNYSIEEVSHLLNVLGDERKRQQQSTDSDTSWRTFVVVNAIQDQALYEKMSAMGVTDTIAIPWALGDPKFDSLDAKLVAMQNFSDQYIV